MKKAIHASAYVLTLLHFYLSSSLSHYALLTILSVYIQGVRSGERDEQVKNQHKVLMQPGEESYPGPALMRLHYSFRHMMGTLRCAHGDRWSSELV